MTMGRHKGVARLAPSYETEKECCELHFIVWESSNGNNFGCDVCQPTITETLLLANCSPLNDLSTLLRFVLEPWPSSIVFRQKDGCSIPSCY